MKKYFISVILVVIMLICYSIPVSAHEAMSDFDTYVEDNGAIATGSETIGWAVHEGDHIGKTSITYKFENTVSEFDRTIFNAAMSLWENYTDAELTEVQSFNADVFVRSSTLDDGTMAYAAPITYTSYNDHSHATLWRVVLNSTYSGSFPIPVLAHEIGHVFGLADVYESYNWNKIMFGTRSTNPQSPTNTLTQPASADIKGFNFITGIHSSHTYTYTGTKKICSVCDAYATRNYTWVSLDMARHKGTCSITGEVVYGYHYEYVTGVQGCTLCGYTGEYYSPYKGDPPLVEEY